MIRLMHLGKCLAAIAASMSFPLGAFGSDIYVELARSCSDETSAQNKLTVVTAEPMIEVTGPQSCIDKTTRVRLVVTGIKTYKNRFQTESIELALTSESSDQWMQLQKAWLGKEWVLMSGQRSILYARVFNEQTERNLTIFAKDEPEAKQIAASITSELYDAKRHGN